MFYLGKKLLSPAAIKIQAAALKEGPCTSSQHGDKIKTKVQKMMRHCCKAFLVMSDAFKSDQFSVPKKSGMNVQILKY